MKAITKRQIDGLADRIIKLRASVGLSQQFFATRAGISIPRLREAERYGAATTDTLNRIAKAFCVSVDDLTGRLLHAAPTAAPEESK